MAVTPRDGSQVSQGPALPNGSDAVASWGPLLVALVLPIVLLQVAIVRPNMTQLDRMRGQVARLEATISELKSKGEGADRSAALLATLGEQESRINSAEASLDRMLRLQQRIEAGVAATARSVASLERLDHLARGVQQQGDLIDRATGALADLANAPGELQLAIDQASRVAPKAQQVRSLADRLEQAERLTAASSQRVDKLLAAQRELAIDAEQVAAATTTLRSLAELESRLNAPLMAVEASHDQLDELLRLKDAVLAQTENLPEAFETLELIVELHGDYQRANGVLRTVQRLMADMVMLEPSIARVASVLEPIVDRSSLGRLTGQQLRLVLTEMRERHSEALARANEQERTTSPVPQVASLPEPEETK